MPEPTAPRNPKEPTPWWVWLIGSLTVLVLAGAAIYIAVNRVGDSEPAPTVVPTQAPTTAPSPTAEPTPEPTPATEEELAFEAAQQRYRDFLPVFAEARVDWDNTKLSGDWLTVELATFFVNDFARFADSRARGVTNQWTQDVQSIEPVSWVPEEEYVIHVCAITNSRFIDADGNDVTKTGPEEDAPLSPINTTARGKDIAMVWDGEQWRLNGFMQASNEGEPC